MKIITTCRYYHSKIESLKYDQNWWKALKSLSTKTNDVHLFHKLSEKVSGGDMHLLAEEFGNHFSSISTSMPKISGDRSNNGVIIPESYYISVEDVETKLSKVKLNKSSGPDEIPNWILRDCAVLLSSPLAAIFNASVRECSIPKLWKRATVIPVAKIAKPVDITSDFRPISLTPVLSKILESFIYNWLFELLSTKFDSFQFGAIKQSSTCHALVKLLHDWTNHTDDSKANNYVHVLLLDYSKAFDRINGNILLQKLEDYNIPEFLILWVESFLSERSQQVKIGNSRSSWTDIWGNVPQGTLLGIMLFLIMINDLETCCPSVKFVDDSTIYELGSFNQKSITSLQVATNEADSWSDKNYMNINSKKTKEMFITFKKDKDPPPELNIKGENIERVDKIKLLGVHINSSLNWNDHVTSIFQKASNRIFTITLLKRSGVKSSDLCVIYSSIIRSLLEYAAPVWHPGLTGDQSDMLENIQKRVMRIIYPNLKYQKALELCKLPTLQSRKSILCKRFFEKIKNDDDKLNYILNDFKKSCNYDIRHNSI